MRTIIAIVLIAIFAVATAQVSRLHLHELFDDVFDYSDDVLEFANKLQDRAEYRAQALESHSRVCKVETQPFKQGVRRCKGGIALSTTATSSQCKFCGVPGVSFFEHCNFEGESFHSGVATNGWIGGSHGMWWNDRISAVAVSACYEVTIYEHANFQGKSMTIRDNGAACLVQNGFNDQLSSYVVKKIC